MPSPLPVTSSSPARSTGTIPVGLQMAASAPDACQGATFPLTFTAYGSPVAPTPATTTPPGGATTRGASGFAFTGTDARPLVLIGLGALGAGVVLLTRRRRTSSVES